MNNEGLSNEWQGNTPMEQELTPWLHRRLEERARPLNSRVLAVDKPALISTSDQKLLRLKRKSNRIVDSVVGRIGLTSGKFQADKLPLFSRDFRSIISRTVNIGASNLYKMLNLPWFRPKRGYKKEPVYDSGLVVRQEMPGDSADGLNDTMMQPPTESVEKNRINDFGLVVHQEIPGDSADGLNDTKIPPLTESVEENRSKKLRKTPESYINYMISPPITRKTIMNINNQDQDSMPEKSSSLRTSHMAKTYSLIDAERNNRDLSRIPRSINRLAIDKEVIQDRFRVQQDNRTVKTTSYPSLLREDEDKGQVTATGEEKKKTETIDYPSLLREDKDKGQMTAAGEEKKKTGTNHYPSLLREDRDAGQITVTGNELTKLDISSKGEGNKENPAYPVKNLFYKKPLPIVRKIFQSLPFVRNIQRKEILPSGSVNHPVDQRQTAQSDNYGHLDNLEIGSTYNESPRVTPVNADLPVSPDINRTARKSYPINQEFQDTGHESQTIEPQKLNKSAISREAGIKVDTSLAYPVKDLFYRKPLPLTRRIMQSLPLVKNIQRKAILSSEPAKQSTDQRQTEQSDNYRSLENHETEALYPDYTKVYKPAQELPLISRAISSTKPVFHRNGFLSGDSSIAMPDLIMPVNNSLDLTLAPVSRMSAIQRQEEYSRIEQSPAEPKITQSTQKIQTAAAPTSEISAEATTESRESSTSINENMPDYRTIARETYPFIRRMIMVERERRPSR